jgi:DivIVA domain-containing protein
MSEQITAALEQVTHNPLPAPRDPEFRMVVRGYDREEVDAHIARLRRELEQERASRSPSSAVKRALEQVGEEVADILKRAHETAAELSATSRREADERLEGARRAADERIAEAKVKAAALTADAEARVRELDLDTDRIWAERDRIVTDVRELARQLIELADAAAERFPPEELDEVVDAEPVDGEQDHEPVDAPGRNGSDPVGPA